MVSGGGLLTPVSPAIQGHFPSTFPQKDPYNFLAKLHPASACRGLCILFCLKCPFGPEIQDNALEVSRRREHLGERQWGGAINLVSVGDTQMVREEALLLLRTVNTKVVSPEWFPPSSDTGGNGKTPVKSKK